VIPDGLRTTRSDAIRLIVGCSKDGMAKKAEQLRGIVRATVELTTDLRRRRSSASANAKTDVSLSAKSTPGSTGRFEDLIGATDCLLSSKFNEAEAARLVEGSSASQKSTKKVLDSCRPLPPFCIASHYSLRVSQTSLVAVDVAVVIQRRNRSASNRRGGKQRPPTGGSSEGGRHIAVRQGPTAKKGAAQRVLHALVRLFERRLATPYVPSESMRSTPPTLPDIEEQPLCRKTARHDDDNAMRTSP
jgi:hypothetical protein